MEDDWSNRREGSGVLLLSSHLEKRVSDGEFKERRSTAAGEVSVFRLLLYLGTSKLSFRSLRNVSSFPSIISPSLTHFAI